MFGRKKEKKKQNVTTYVEGVEQHPEAVHVPTPEEHGYTPMPAESPALEQQAVQEPTPQPESITQQFEGECILCFDFKWYADQLGVWHACPRCNKDGRKNTPQADETDSQGRKPSKGNLYEFRFCKECGAQHEIHKKKKKWKCDECGVSQ